MATATLLTDLTVLNTCDTTDGWSGVTPTSETGFMVEGAACCAFLIKTSGTTEATYALSSATDLSNTHVRMWFISILKTRLASFASGGIAIVLSDGTNTGYWYVSGGDKYSGGWDLLVLDTTKTPDEGTAPTMTSITSVGFRLDLDVAAVGTVPTTWIDWMSYGKGYLAYGGTSGDEIGVAEIDTQDVYYGLIGNRSGVYFLNGELQLGDSSGTNTTYFKDAGQMLVFLDEVVNSSLYKIVVKGNSTGSTYVDLSGNFITSVDDDLEIDFSDNTNVDEIKIDGTLFQNVTTFTGSDIVSGVNTVFDTCGMLEPELATLEKPVIKNSPDTSALYLELNHNISDAVFESAGTGHAIYIDTTGSYTLSGFTYSGYASVDGSTGNEVIYNNSGGAVTINVSGGDTPTVRNGTGSTTTVISNPVTTKITVKDLSTGSAIQDARVFVVVSDGSNFPYQDSVTITGSGTTATVSHSTHGLATGDYIVISGANEDVYNGVYSITVIDSDSYTYTTSETINTSPATGTILATMALISGTTDVNGEISDTRTISTNQPISGRVRKSSSSPYYISQPIAGIVDSSSGFTALIQLVRDE